MSSPVKIHLKAFISIDRHKKEAVYMQIAYQFINAVKRNILEVDDRLPGSRKMAEELGVHRKTLVAALSELQEQGWVKSLPNIGVYVSSPDQTSAKTARVRAFQQPLKKAAFNFRKEFILDKASEENASKFAFTDGTPDYRLIKPEELVRFYTSVLKRKKKTPAFLNSNEQSQFFKNQLSYYLNLTRNFHLSRDFLLPVTNLENSLSILSRLLIKRGDIVLVEELSNFLPNMVFGQAGAEMATLPQDRNGMDVNAIKTRFAPGDIRLVYINTKAQYPTTAVLSEKRKDQLLQLAEDYNFIILEDDTDYEFSSVRKTEDSLFRKDGGKRVIYIGSFGRFLMPAFQMNFLIGPRDFLQEAEKYLSLFGTPDLMMTRALGEIIHLGDIHRYRRKSTKVITERKERFAQLLDFYFKDAIKFEVPQSGLAFWIAFKDRFSLTRLQENAKEKGVFIPKICLYQNRTITALRLGFAHLDATEMQRAIKLLAEAFWELEEN